MTAMLLKRFRKFRMLLSTRAVISNYTREILCKFCVWIIQCLYFFDFSYLIRPSPFSAQKTFERHNSRRKSNISFCSAQLLQEMPLIQRRNSAPRPPSLLSKANSLSLPDSPQQPPFRGRSNSLRVSDDILLRRFVFGFNWHQLIF